jgi:hypothetical protein
MKPVKIVAGLAIASGLTAGAVGIGAVAERRTGLGRSRSSGMGSPAFIWTHPRRLERRMGTERRAVRIQPVHLGVAALLMKRPWSVLVVIGVVGAYRRQRPQRLAYAAAILGWRRPNPHRHRIPEPQ